MPDKAEPTEVHDRNEELSLSAMEALHTCLRLLMRFAFKRRLTNDTKRDLIRNLEYAKDRVEKMS